jgi:N-acetylglucosamine kinase-like BadF-type ATPase
LGVDAGGTKTHAIIADAGGHIWGVGRSGAANWEGVGQAGVYQALAESLMGALREARLSPADLCAAGYGLAGLNWPSDEGRLWRIVERLGVNGPAVLVNDAYAALAAGSDDGSGVAVIAGTGSTIAGRNRRGETFRTLGIGSWGDFGSASDIVSLAIRAVVHAYTGRGPPTALTERLLALYQAGDISEVAEKVFREQDRRIGSAQAPLVVEVAREGDKVACEILQQVGRELGRNTVAVAHRLGLTREAFDVVLAGGVFRAQTDLLIKALEAEVCAAAPRAHLRLLHWSPAVGSIMLAMNTANRLLTDELRHRLKTEALRLPALGVNPTIMAHSAPRTSDTNGSGSNDEACRMGLSAAERARLRKAVGARE